MKPLSVEEAQKHRVCRFCQKDNHPYPGNPFLLRYGTEYAHQDCWLKFESLPTPAELATLKSTLADKDKELEKWKTEVEAWKDLNSKHAVERDHLRAKLESLRTDAATKDKTIGELRDLIKECAQPLETLMRLESVFVGLGNPHCDKAVQQAKSALYSITHIIAGVGKGGVEE